MNTNFKDNEGKSQMESNVGLLAQQIVVVEPGLFSSIGDQYRSIPIPLQRALVYLCYSTDMSGSASIDGKIGPGTMRAIDQFCKEHDDEELDPALLLGEVEQKIVNGTEEAAQMNVEYLDRLQNRSFMSSMEVYMTYWDAIHESEPLSELGLNPALILSLILVETAGVARIRFESHVWDRHGDGHDPRERRFLSSSFGLFQEMGFNLERTGFLPDYLADQGDVERQFEAIARFITKTPALLKELKSQTPNYDEIAYAYNGPGFRQNNYHEKLSNAHAEFTRILGTFGH